MAAIDQQFRDVMEKRGMRAAIESLHDGAIRSHFLKIVDSHPDFHDIANSDELATWINSLPEADQEEAGKVLHHGTADQVNRLLDQYKKSK